MLFCDLWSLNANTVLLLTLMHNSVSCSHVPLGKRFVSHWVSPAPRAVLLSVVGLSKQCLGQHWLWLMSEAVVFWLFQELHTWDNAVSQFFHRTAATKSRAVVRYLCFSRTPPQSECMPTMLPQAGCSVIFWWFFLVLFAAFQSNKQT